MDTNPFAACHPSLIGVMVVMHPPPLHCRELCVMTIKTFVFEFIKDLHPKKDTQVSTKFDDAKTNVLGRIADLR